MVAWYTLHSKPNAEYQVATALQRRGIQTYLPEIEAPKARNRRQRKPFFPCYLFCQVDFKTIGISDIRWTPGLRRILAFGGQPVPLADQMIELIRYKLGEIEATGGWPEHTFLPGDTVRITDGPFRDMLAIFEGPTTAARRVQVLLNILGACRAQVDVTDLKKVPSDATTSAPKRSRRTRGRGRRLKGTTW